jgi:ABC-type transport system involved in multi-copper enzyme maturation permease subunit
MRGLHGNGATTGREHFVPRGLDVRLGPGPVFAYEWLTTTRRWQLYALRALFVSVILAGMMFTWQVELSRTYQGQTVSLQQLAEYGERFYFTIVSIELTLVLLAAPAATAGAICLDKARGTLEHMLATDLSNAEIVLGKLGARLVPVLGLIVCVVPILSLAGLLGGIDPLALFGSFSIAVACGVLGCSLALMLSVWGRKTHEVLMLTYLILILWVLGPLLWIMVYYSIGSSPSARFLWEAVILANPYYLAFAPYSQPGTVGLTTYLVFLAVCLGLSGLFVGLSTLRIRKVVLKQAGQPADRSRRGRFTLHLPRPVWLPHLPGPSLDGNPVLWREWHRSRPTRFLRLVWILYAGLGVLWTVLSLQIAVRGDANSEGLVAGMNVFQVGVGLLLLSVSASTSLAEERVRGSLDVLLSTPLSTRSILIGKWWGAFRQVPFLLIWPALTTGFLVMVSGRLIQYVLLLGLITAYGACIASLGLALATWVSRLGRAVALCVSLCVLFTFGWMFLVVLLFKGGPGDGFIFAVIVGSPLPGTLFGTLVVASAPGGLPNDGVIWIVIGTFIWTLIHGTIALILFTATLATFDRCLGRIPETDRLSTPMPRKRPIPELDFELLSDRLHPAD